MDHTYASYDTARSWRTATLVASAVAAVELAVIVAIGVVALGDHVQAEAKRAALAPVKRTPPAASAVLPRAETSVVVLNGNGQAGAATTAGEIVRGKGYIVSSVGNAPRANPGATAVMYRAGRRGEAQRLARDLGVKVVGPLDGVAPRDLLGAHLALVLGSG